MSKIFFVLPAYNEEANIESVVTQWLPVVQRINGNPGDEAHLVIANDGSKDNTYKMLCQLAEKHPELTPVDKPNSGHGATVLHLYRYALDTGADYVFQTDSDGQTNPDEFWQMWNAREEYDFQIGARNDRQDGASRVFVTKVLKLVVRLTFGVDVPDANTPFRLMKAGPLREIMALIPSDFFLSNVAISAIAVKKGKKCIWYPITFKPRQGGVNSINMKRIFKIGRQAIGDFRTINRNLLNFRM